jgi:NUMOD3 motif
LILFIRNKYWRWYEAILANPDIGPDTEKHHRIPRSLGGSNHKDNLVRISYRKHFLVHWLLTKCTEGVNRKRMLQAFGMMLVRPLEFSSIQYAAAKKSYSEGRRGCISPMKGKKFSEEFCRKISLRMIGSKHTEEHKRNIGNARRGFRHTEEAKEKIRIAHIGQKMPVEAVKKMAASKRGVPLTPQHRAKVSASLMGNTRSVGRIHSVDTRDKMSLSHLKNPKAQSNNKLNLKGVVLLPSGKFRARTVIRGRLQELGLFDCPAAAHLAYVIAVDTSLSL